MDLVPHQLSLNADAARDYVGAIEEAAGEIAQATMVEQAAQLRYAQQERSHKNARHRVNQVRRQLLESINRWRSLPEHEPVMRGVAWAEVLTTEAALARAAQEMGVPEGDAKTGALKMRQHYCRADIGGTFQDGGVEAAAAATDVAIEEDVAPKVTPAAATVDRQIQTSPARPAVPAQVRVVG